MVTSSKSMTMSKTQIGVYLAGLLSTVNSLPGLMFFPKIKTLLTQIETAVQAEEAVIFAALPETFSVANLIDTFFAWAKTKYPTAEWEIAILQFAVDGLLAAAPSL